MAQMGVTSVAECGVVPVAAVYIAGIVVWRIPCRHYRENTTAYYPVCKGLPIDGTDACVVHVT